VFYDRGVPLDGSGGCARDLSRALRSRYFDELEMNHEARQIFDIMLELV